MTNEEAKEKLYMEWQAFLEDNIDYAGVSEAYKMAFKALDEQEQKMGWIPVSERLPEIHNYMQEYMVTIKGNFIRTAFFTETNGKSWWSKNNVIAWMPLPKPSEKEGE